MRISDWSSDVCSSDLTGQVAARLGPTLEHRPARLNRSDATARRSTRLPFLRLADKDGQPLFRRSRSCLPVLKKGTCFSDKLTAAPVRGLRPTRASRRLTEKAPKPRSSTRSPRPEEHTAELQPPMR